MADKEKELRQMNRTELIEIIYALQQNEKILREENENLKRQVSEKVLRIEKAGSIAEAALSLNHIFEDAQKASEQYLESIREREASLRLSQESVLESARADAEKISQDAQRQAEEIIAAANAQAKSSLRESEEAEQRIRRMAAAFKKQRRHFLDQANAFMEENPEFAEQIHIDPGRDAQTGGVKQ